MSANLEYEVVSETLIDESGAAVKAEQPEVEKTTGSGKKTRTPKSGSKTSKITPKALATQLIGGHKILAVLTKDRTWEIDEKEADALAVAITEVMQQYNIVVNPKVVAWTHLVTVGAAIYGPRAYMVYAAKVDAEKAKQREREILAQTADII